MFAKIYALIMFNVLDYYFTIFLLLKGYQEANPIMVKLFSSGDNAQIAKLIIGPALLILMYAISKTRGTSKNFDRALDVLLILYAFINAVHIYLMIQEGIFV